MVQWRMRLIKESQPIIISSLSELALLGVKLVEQTLDLLSNHLFVSQLLLKKCTI